ncbi:MAG TPA: [protein-PII] uridylyltransferase [Actinocrinis sp.]|jgi:[protein-PII] uridylyltransferase
MAVGRTYAQRRAELIESGLRGPGLRSALSEAADQWLTELHESAGAASPAGRTALVAVGGYGRGELSPGSDLDVVLLHEDSAKPARIAALADAIWYPVWDAKVKLDHSVRSVGQARSVAKEDLPVALGLLTARHVAGEAELTAQLRASALADWRAAARARLPEARASRAERLRLHGELAYRLEGDLKEAIGGLRDAYLLTAISASWLADTPHGEPELALARLLDVRDTLHIATGRSADRLLLQEQDEVARLLELDGGADELLAVVADAARTIAFACDTAWRRIGQILAENERTQGARSGFLSGARRQLFGSSSAAAERVPLADGVVEADGEASLALAADPAKDPVLLLRAAAAAAAAGLPLAPSALRRLADEAAPLPDRWPRPAREEFVRLLGAGPGLIEVWEALDRTGLLVRLLPEWERIRCLPQRNALHIHTVDRHSVQTAVHAASRARRVARPDLLLVAAVCHDLGKGLPGDHGESGAAIVDSLAPRIGFNAADAAVLAALVRHHLLLAQLAMHRDPEDPATLEALLAAARPPDDAGPFSADPGEFVALLHALTEADSEATGPAVWNRWRTALIGALADRARASLAGRPAPAPPAFDGSALAARAAAAPDGLAVLALAPGGAGVARLDIALPDELGVLATVAGVLSLSRLRILAADVETAGADSQSADSTGTDRTWAVQRWTVAAEFGDLPDVSRLRTDLRGALAGRIDPAERMKARDAESSPVSRALLVAAPTVGLVDDASLLATVVEVRARDTPGLLYRVCAAIARAGASIATARVSTLGAEAVDVFYLTDPEGERLNPKHAEAVVAEIAEAMP